MEEKFIFFILSVIISFLCFSTKNKYLRYIFLIILLIIFSFPLAYREYIFPWEAGSDYYYYNYWFNNIILVGMNNVGFNLFMIITKSIYNNFPFFLLICGFVYNIIIYFFIIKFSLNKLLSIILYISFIYFRSYNILRQCLACALFLYGFNYIFTKESKKYILTILLATSFHTSALGLLLLYPYLNIEAFKIKKIFILVFSLLSYIYFYKIVDFIFNISSILKMDYLEKYKDKYGFEVSNYTLFIIFSIITIFFIVMKYKKLLKSRYDDIYFDILVLCLALSLLSVRHLIFSRMLMYLTPFIIILIPMTLKLFVNNFGKKIYVFFITILSLYSLLF